MNESSALMLNHGSYNLLHIIVYLRFQILVGNTQRYNNAVYKKKKINKLQFGI